jgi:hypothetical protein
MSKSGIGFVEMKHRAYINRDVVVEGEYVEVGED